jgi:predicted RNase H-like HicB family nuclease
MTWAETSSTGVKVQSELCRSTNSGLGRLLFPIATAMSKTLRQTSISATKQSGKPVLYSTELHCLSRWQLLKPISAIVEIDGDEYLARTVDIPLYAVGKTDSEALDGLRQAIESLHEDLMEDDNFSGDWLRIKEYLKTVVVKGTS